MEDEITNGSYSTVKRNVWVVVKIDVILDSEQHFLRNRFSRLNHPSYLLNSVPDG